MSLTGAQQQAVEARGNVLVMAGAGTGKTRALVERCLHCLLHEVPRTSLDEILVVTFTEAAAAEMRQRIRARLEQELERNPADLHWQEQIAIFETAHIGTLHSFCLKLLRQHFYELELDPQLSVLAEEEARLLAEETLDELLRKYYEGEGSDVVAVQQLIQAQGKGSDLPIRGLILRLHHYSQTLPAPDAWFAAQLEMFTNPQPEAWRTWFLEAVFDWVRRSTAAFEAQARGNDVAAECHAALCSVSKSLQLSEACTLLQSVNSAVRGCPPRRKSAWLKPLQPFVDDATFLGSLATTDPGVDPLLDDWNWARLPMTTLVRLAREFGASFAHAKRELGSVDFHDLEQHALRLLWDTQANQPTPVARQWRDQLRFVFVDEYQDINAAQDRILQALSREHPDSNRFLVGDVKQSIYRFRLANPRIFQTYATTWRTGAQSRDGGRVIPLVENFRSRQGILTFINFVFEGTMRRELGGVAYDEEAWLTFGASDQRQLLAELPGSSPGVELHLRIKGNHQAGEPDAELSEALEEISELEETAKEARLVALRLRELKTAGHPVWDEKQRDFRPVDWGDMALLLRAPAGKTESFAREFARVGVPLQVERGGFYSSSEVSDLLSLLQLLDNPLQDLPALAVLHSPLVGLSLKELAEIRLAALKAPFWTALFRWHKRQPEDSAQPAAVPNPELHGKVSVFLGRFNHWRRLARQICLSRCLEIILAETHYATWLQLQPRGQRRHANVRRFLALAQQFDQLQRQGLFRFLRFIEAQQRAGTEPEVPPDSNENAVRLLSIHQSKGLEFPVVVVADLGKSFNTLDLRAEIILDEEFGLCPQVTPPGIRKRYPSLAHWLASRRQKRELLGEELRLLYVAMTRARDLLLLTCSMSQKRHEDAWGTDGEPLDPAEARSCADWLARSLRGSSPPQNGPPPAEPVHLHHSSGDCRLLWFVHNDSSLLKADTPPHSATAAASDDRFVVPDTDWKGIRQRLAWQYAYSDATREPAKTTVSALRRRAAGFETYGGQLSSTAHQEAHSPGSPHRVPPALGTPTGADIGTAHHLFLQRVALDKTQTATLLHQEALRLQEQGVLSLEQAALLDLDALAAFWQSQLGCNIREQREFVHRELPFTFRLSPEELAHYTGQAADGETARRAVIPDLPRDEFVVVQGVADLAVILPTEIWLLDFKTDRIPAGGEPPANRYAPQLKLYARALNLIYGRPVTQCWLWFLAGGRGVAVESC